MGRRPSFDHWHYRHLDLPSGDTLTWLVIDRPDPPRIEAFRLASRGAIHHPDGHAILAAHGHPDAAVRLPRDGPIQ